ncbi:putative RNA-directed DNA polymerase from transposon X-element [Caerostris extrusa]|uniref:RNA-directed DNA polymerase from transposon X-element n=1 Tax=Caerostris extrusa TaxID=172846 RepID=A0AAV4QYQ9_CAEEX|nr:putative RNA-directed DNA polymerase from transposon X-element [Caerostris extrusa]
MKHNFVISLALCSLAFGWKLDLNRASTKTSQQNWPWSQDPPRVFKEIRPLNSSLHAPLTCISLRFGSWNSNGLIKHLNEVIEFVSDHDLDLFLIQETCLQPGREPNIPNFTLYKNDRINFTNFRSSGGTCIYVKNSLNHYQLPTPQMTGIEATIINLQVTDNTKNRVRLYLLQKLSYFPD